MAALDFLTVTDRPENLPIIHRLLDEFQRKTGHSIWENAANWDTLWEENANAAAYGKGADLAEIGTTWLESLVTMKALRPFQTREIEAMGGATSFLPGSWSTVKVGEDKRVWGIPVRSDARILWYWKDMLEEAKLDPATAFSSFEQFPETFEILRNVTPTPWAIPTHVTDTNTLHTLSTWVWQAGGDFISPDGKNPLFTQPESIRGMRAFFGLSRYMPNNNGPIDGTEAKKLFSQRKICATINGPWLLTHLTNRSISLDRVGVTMIPGPSLVGGTLIVIYKHCRNPALALEFINFLLEDENARPYANLMGLLPTRHAIWANEPLASNPIDQAFYQALSHGRSYPAVPRWGMIEQKLLGAISSAWESLLIDNPPTVDAVIDKYFTPLARRLAVTLGG